MAETPFTLANQKLFITAQHLSMISGRLLLDRVGPEAVIEHTEALTLERELNADGSLASLADAVAERFMHTTEKTLLSDYFDGQEIQDLSLAKRIMASAATVILSGAPVGRWTAVDQAKADIEDEICQAFGSVNGYLLDQVAETTIRLNTEPDEDDHMKIVTFHVTDNPRFRIVNIDNADLLLDGSIEHFGGTAVAADFIETVDARLRSIAYQQ